MLSPRALPMALVSTLCALALFGCGHRESPSSIQSSVPNARGAIGTLVLTPAALALGSSSAAPSGDALRVLVATEAEVLESRQLAAAAAKHLGLGETNAEVEKLQKAVTVTPRGDSLVLEVKVLLDERDLAVSLCNALMETYVDARLEDKAMGIQTRLKALDEEIAGLEDAKRDPAREKQLEGLRSERSTALRDRETMSRDARVLDRCAAVERN